MSKSPKVFTAMVTPFDANGEISPERTTDLIEYLLRNGTQGLVVAGTTGESATLTNTEKRTLFKHVVRVVDGRIPVYAASGSNNTAASIELTKEAETIGADGIMLVTPYYNKPSQAGLYRHFQAIANQTSLPIMLYNIPGRSAVNLHSDTIIELSKIENIVSLKEAGGDLNHLTDVLRHTFDDFLVYCGEDSQTLPMLSVGATGVVSVASHVIGSEIYAMIKALAEGNTQEAADAHRSLLPLMRALFNQPSPGPVKAALDALGIETGDVRLPLLPLTNEQDSALQAVLHETIKNDKRVHH